MREIKSSPAYIKAIDGRTVTGIFSVFGNLDAYNDRIWPGAFTKTLAERRGKLVHLWQHDFDDPPTAVIRSIREVTREELPPEVLAAAPAALGGCEVTREYLDTPKGNEVLAALLAGSPLQMSFGFDAVKYDFEEDPNAQYEWQQIRNIREVRLWETSDVLWGANDATTANSSKAAPVLHSVLHQLDAALRQIKAGARHSESDYKLLDQAAQILVDLGARNVTLTTGAQSAEKTAPTPPKKAEPSASSLTLEGMKVAYLDFLTITEGV